MTKKENKKSNKVVRDMKECFRSFHLPIDEIKSPQNNLMNVVFTSQICNDHFCADAVVIYERQVGYVRVEMTFRSNVPPEKMAEISQLLNLLNGERVINSYSVCQYYNIVSVRAGLFLSGEVLAKGKFRRLIHDMLEDTYLCSPLIAKVVAGGNPEALYDRFMDDHKDLMSKESKLSEEAKRKILVDIETVMTGLKMFIKHRHQNGFITDCMFKDMDFPFRMVIFSDDETVVINLGAPFTVPHEKIPVMMELINRANRVLASEHLFIPRQGNRVLFFKGVMIDNGVFDKREFEKSIRTLWGSGCSFFPIIKEQLSSNESPEVLMCKYFPGYSDKAKGH